MGGNQVLSITLKGERQREREGGGGLWLSEAADEGLTAREGRTIIDGGGADRGHKDEI